MADDLSDTGAAVEKADYETLASFRYALRQFLRFSESAAHAVGLTPQQHQALLTVMGYPGRDQVSIGELAERLQIHHNSAVGLVDRLVAHGLMVRHQAADDRRRVMVSVTPAGEALLARLSAAHRTEIRRLAPTLAALAAALER